MTATPTYRGPARTGERALAPDLARGAMLLLIVLANTPWYLYGSEPGSSTVHPEAPRGPIDTVVQFVIMTVVDMRVYPMFAFLFGYGIVQLYRRQLDAGTPAADARRLLRRRHLWMIIFGLVHAALLWYGDILGAYGLAGLIMVALFFKRKDRTLRVWAIILTSLVTLSLVGAIVGAIFVATIPPEATGAEPFNFLAVITSVAGQSNYLISIPMRLGFWVALTLAQAIITLIVPAVILIAFLAGRQQILERPIEHLPLLRRVAVIGIAIGWIGGGLHALEHVGLLGIPATISWLFSATQPATGLFCGIGYVAVFGLIAARYQRTGRQPGIPVVAVTALGQRSLSGYLAQSVICAPAFAAWGLGLGGWFSSAPTALFSTIVWLLTVVAAYLMQQRSLRGPAEMLLRRLIYRRAAVPAKT